MKFPSAIPVIIDSFEENTKVYSKEERNRLQVESSLEPEDLEISIDSIAQYFAQIKTEL